MTTSDDRSYHLRSYERILRSRIEFLDHDERVEALLALLGGAKLADISARLLKGAIPQHVFSEFDAGSTSDHERALWPQVHDSAPAEIIPQDIHRLLSTLIREVVEWQLERAFSSGYSARFQAENGTVVDDSVANQKQSHSSHTGGRVAGIDCWCCVKGVGPIHTTTGLLGRPLGVCFRCHCLACGHHAHRDRRLKYYICVECDVTLLAASAAVRSAGPNPDLQSLAAVAVPKHGAEDLLNELWLFTSVEDFFERRPGYENRLRIEAKDQARRMDWVDSARAREMFASLHNEGAREMLALSALLVLRLKIPWDEVPDALVAVVKALPQ